MWCFALCALLALDPLPAGMLSRLPDILNVAISVAAEAWPDPEHPDDRGSTGDIDDDVPGSAESVARKRLAAVDAFVLSAVAAAGADTFAGSDVTASVRSSLRQLVARVGAEQVEGALAGVDERARQQIWDTFLRD